MIGRFRRRALASLRFKVTFLIVAALAPFLVAYAAYDIYSQRQSQEQVLLEKGRLLAQTEARVVGEVFDRAIATGELTPEQVFDAEYVQIPGTQPPRFHTAYDTFTDAVFQQIIDEALLDQDVVFATFTDRNGYVPTHNGTFSINLDDPSQNRSKRVFDDPVGLAAARNTGSVLQQVYQRDTGETLWDISVPITVQGKHWGAFRVGFSIERVEARLAETSRRVVLSMLGVLAVVAVVATLIAGWIARALGQVAELSGLLARRDLPKLVDAIGRVADGDLTQEVTVSAAHVPVRSSDELGRMAADFNAVVDRLQETGLAVSRMTVGLREMLGRVQRAADDVAETSHHVGQMTAQTTSAVQQVTQAMQSVTAGAQETAQSTQRSQRTVGELALAVDGIAQGASEQAVQVEQAVRAATRMAAGIERVAGNSQVVALASEETKVSAEQGVQAVRETVSGMHEIKAVVTDATSKVGELGQLGQRIGAVVETIDDIAEQTNLLALNAAIEAARAGEHGRGFAVVADEVRKLAERSQRETKAISDLIREVQAGTEDAVDAMAAGSRRVEQGVMKADQAGVALSEILAAVQATVEQVGEIAATSREMSAEAQAVVETMSSISAVVEENSAATEEMAVQTSQVTAAIQGIAAVTEGSSATTEQVSASAEEMRSQVEAMNAQAEALAGTAEQLKGLVARFRLDTEAAVADRVVPPGRSRDWHDSRHLERGRLAG